MAIWIKPGIWCKKLFYELTSIDTVIMPTILSKAGCLLFCLMFIVSVLKKEKFFKIFHPGREREDGEETEVWDFLESKGEGPEERTLKREVLSFLQEAIEKLPPQMKEVIVLCDVMNYSYEEASEIIGCPLGTVRSRLHRARKKVRSLVEESYGEDFLSIWG